MFWELLEPLERYSLVERLPNDAFKLHRLTQEVVKDSLSEEGQRDWAKRVVRALNAAYPLPEFENWKLCERLQPSVRLSSELARTYKLESTEVGRMFNEAGRFAWVRGEYANAKLFNELSLKVYERVLGSEHPYTLTSRNNLAMNLHALGDLAGARKLHEQTLEIWERVLGSEHPSTLTVKDNLAITLSDLGELTGAKKLLEQILEIRERVLGIEHLETLQSRNDLATTLWDLGDSTEARKLLEPTLEIFERVQGVEHPNTLQVRNNLAEIFRDLGALAGARNLHERTLEIRERVLGVEHPDTTASALNLFHTVRQLNDTEAAARLIDKLRWLLNRDEDSIPSAMQRKIRQYLLNLLGSS